MEQAKKIELLDKQIAAGADGNPDDFNLWKQTTEVVLRNVIGDSNPLYQSFLGVRYSPSVWISGMDTRPYKVGGIREGISILQAAKVEVELGGGAPSASQKDGVHGADVFIVHGHDDAKKHEVARFLSDLTKRKPIILHEQANNGKTLIEKFEQYAASAGYAVVIATADDTGGPVGASDLKPRARQNVVFELGFFFGALGRDKVALLYEEGVEKPSDVDGLVYLPLDQAGAWKMSLARDIEGAGVGVDWEALR